MSRNRGMWANNTPKTNDGLRYVSDLHRPASAPFFEVVIFLVAFLLGAAIF